MTFSVSPALDMFLANISSLSIRAALTKAVHNYFSIAVNWGTKFVEGMEKIWLKAKYTCKF